MADWLHQHGVVSCGQILCVIFRALLASNKKECSTPVKMQQQEFCDVNRLLADNKNTCIYALRIGPKR